jgi:hypothetical protein
MYSNPFVVQLVANEAMEDTIRRAEHAHLVRVAEGSRMAWRWRLPTLSVFKSLLTPVIRPQFRRRVKI